MTTKLARTSALNTLFEVLLEYERMVAKEISEDAELLRPIDAASESELAQDHASIDAAMTSAEFEKEVGKFVEATGVALWHLAHARSHRLAGAKESLARRDKT